MNFNWYPKSVPAVDSCLILRKHPRLLIHRYGEASNICGECSNPLPNICYDCQDDRIVNYCDWYKIHLIFSHESCLSLSCCDVPRCIKCLKWFANDCDGGLIWTCPLVGCGTNVCSECAGYCQECEEFICPECRVCDGCKKSLCLNCALICACGEVVCATCCPEAENAGKCVI
jgi:hypothetical protein